MSQRVYLDYAATTPVDSRVEKAMRPYFGRIFGNPGSLHSFGQEAIRAVDLAREEIARALGRPLETGFREIIFTGSATEANNLALRGVLRTARECFSVTGVVSAPAADARLPLMQPTRQRWDQARLHSESCRQSTREPFRLIISAIEHESVLETAKDLEKEGIELVIIPVTKEGVIDLKKFKEALNERTVMVSVMYVNNEIGTIQPIREIAEIIKEFRSKTYNLKPITYPLFHTDASQAFQFLDCNPETLGVDLMTLSSHKIYGPKAVGGLYIKSPFLSPLITGGGQEFGLRSGTENVPGIVGFAKAVQLIEEKKEWHVKCIADLRNYFWKEVKKIFPKMQLNGGSSSPHILNIWFPGYSAEDLLTALDIAGVAVSSGSACRARSLEPSRVIKSLPLRYSQQRACESLRFSFGRPTTTSEVDQVIKVLNKILKSKKV